MADFGTEMEFVAAFAWLAANGHANALKAASHMPPEVLENAPLRSAFRVLGERHAAGRDCALSNAECFRAVAGAMGSPDTLTALTDTVAFAVEPKIGGYARTVLESYRARRQAMLLEDAATEAKRLAAAAPEKARAYGELIADKLVSIQREIAEDHGPESLDEIVDAELLSLESGGVAGIPWPYPMIQEAALGPIQPGDCVGISAHPNGGKSLVLANFVNFWLAQGAPCITFVPEKPDLFHRRMWAAKSRVPQAIAERQQWKGVDDPTMHRYGCAVEWSRGAPWEPVRKTELTVDQIIARARILRRKYPGRHVLLIVDHMYDLVYERGETDRHVAEGVRRLRKFAEQDQDGGMSCVLLFQPVKVKEAEDRYKAVRADQIRGQVAQTLDFHLAPFRRFVSTSQIKRTPWGTPECRYDGRGWPEGTELKDPTGKDDDEHVYFKMDRRKTGGPLAATLVLHIEGPTGFIYETTGRAQ